MAQAVPVAVPPAEPQAESSSTPAPPISPATPELKITSSAPAPPAPPASPASIEGLSNIAIASITANPSQPRQRFDEASLKGLAQSIRNDGVMQPVIVRLAAGSIPAAPRYELVAGERRWRAAQLVGLTEIPAIIRSLDDQQAAEWALIENLQREDLNPIERAEAFGHLLNRYKLNHDQVAQRVGVDRSTITNALRLLNLSPAVRQLVIDGLLSASQAKVLAGVIDPKRQAMLAGQSVRQAWSVRKLETEARKGAENDQEPAGSTMPSKTRRSTHLLDLERQIGQQLGTKVKIRQGRKKGSGTLSIQFYSVDQFDELLGRLGVEVQ